MSGTWNSTNHTISDFVDWNNDNKLVLQPDFQRKAVWNKASRIMLIDTLLKEYPLPKVFIQNTTENSGRTVRKIIDGQQRLNAILDFVQGKIKLENPYEGEFEGLYFSDLPDDVKNTMMRYIIDCNEAYGYTDEQYREIYTRLNKYAIPLNNQELRKAEFPGNFYKLAEKIANLEVLDNWKVFTVASRRRLLDVEFISEILAGLLEGPQDKKKRLDNFYIKYNKENLDDLERRIMTVIDEIKILFPEDSISKTRFKQKSDFYSLVLAIDHFSQQKHSLTDKNVTFLQEDFQYLDDNISPSDEYYTSILTEYAVRCLSSANSVSSRRWRINFLKIILAGTYLNHDSFLELLESYKTNDESRKFLELFDATDPVFHSDMCPLGAGYCNICKNEIYFEEEEWITYWEKGLPLQFSNLHTGHKKGFDLNNHIKYIPTFYPSDLDKEAELKSGDSGFIEDLFGDLND